ncbi:hypothetical protein FHS83_000161 [Rhizomicrobium palustre]|uniref:Uncharacterized protein n=1 Tax=Rhizomicrobium palustre TaxID=189966 RepID=A0A846MU12_9PROT|nr:hypothetical protein [Rhizomicrobium palustre]NIK86843.1 hypothetical protein [Rhizomicrobium palustre]
MNPLDQSMVKKLPRPEGAYDFTNDWMDSLNQRMLLLFEEELTAFEESCRRPDPRAAFLAKLDLVERYLKVRKLANEVMPERRKMPRLKRKVRGKK